MSFLKKLRKYKKAGLELSINAIVILIIALIVLGIGVLFVRGMFGKISAKVTTSITDTEVTKPATPDDPMTLDPSQVSISKSQLTTGAQIIISGYSATTYSDSGPRITSCTGLPTADVPTLTAADQSMIAGKPANWKTILKLAAGNSGDTGICTVVICNAAPPAGGAITACTATTVASEQMIVTITD